MASASSGGTPSAAARDVRVLFDQGALGLATDGQLLRRFASKGSGQGQGVDVAEAAFAGLVARHGPMVLGVCRRVLRDPDDAADAFQATFLVLARKAKDVRLGDGPGDSLGRWLYGVSRRVAARARVDAARRLDREARAAARGEPVEPGADPERAELLAAVDEEVARLPGPFRDAVRLCDLGGLTREAAAARLGCPVGTVESRLTRGRQRLRDRLARRGFGPTLAAPGLFEGLAPPSVPASLSAPTLRAALAAAGPGAASGTVPAAVLALRDGALTDMAWTKTLKLSALTLAAFSALGGLALLAAPGPREPEKTAAKPEATAEPETKLQPPAKIRPGDRLDIEVLEALPGRPISGTRLVRPDGTVSLGFYGDLAVAGLDRNQIKVKVVQHLRRYINDAVLGLEREDPDDENKTVAIPPVESARVFVDESQNFDPRESPRRGDPAVLSAPPKISPGDQLLVEVLKALPGRPISGERLVRPDGTISLGFYGDLAVAGLDRNEAKVKIVEHLRKFLDDGPLGLVAEDPSDPSKTIAVPPVESARVFVDESVGLMEDRSNSGRLTRALDAIEKVLEAQGDAGVAPAPRDRRPALVRPREVPPSPAGANANFVRRLVDHEKRIGEIERKLDRLLKAVEGAVSDKGK